jgi:hypothetical protein
VSALARKRNLRRNNFCEPGGWTFAPVPPKYAPPVIAAWGRTPVHATVDGQAWGTSVWRDKKHGTLLPIPKAIRGDKGDGDVVTAELRLQSPNRTSEE